MKMSPGEMSLQSLRVFPFVSFRCLAYETFCAIITVPTLIRLELR